MDLFEKCESYTEAREAIAKGYYPYFMPIESTDGTEVVIRGKRLIMVGSNNYLGLTNHPKVKEAAIEAIRKYGSGCTGSRFLNGTLDLHEELEDRLAGFMGKEAALVFSTGFQTNQGTISTIVSKGDVVITDRADHASIIDGCRLAYGEMKRFKHNDMKDLEKVLTSCPPDSGKLIVIDGVFSMEGDIADLPGIVELADRYKCRIMVDDAHSIGVLGKGGRGTAEHFGLEEEVDIVMGTFSKSFASIGGFIVADEEVIDYIKHHSRALIFSASMPPAAVATVIAALEVIQTEPERRERLWENTRKMRKGFQEMGFNTGESQTPIIPIIIGDRMKTFQAWKMLFEEGIFTNPAITPSVPPGRDLLRTSYMATHTPEQLDRVLEAFHKVGRKMRIIE
ncbi:MAG: pyridoxal phosphate-dependent aminotransferase family protein [Candidatus Latescibacteria bacterium]|nr:pyridoxal phosphate-dependent aminotransferase family protein [Candidatus Latescibacterota bacterium]